MIIITLAESHWIHQWTESGCLTQIKQHGLLLSLLPGKMQPNMPIIEIIFCLHRKMQCVQYIQLLDYYPVDQTIFFWIRWHYNALGFGWGEQHSINQEPRVIVLSNATMQNVNSCITIYFECLVALKFNPTTWWYYRGNFITITPQHCSSKINGYLTNITREVIK